MLESMALPEVEGIWGSVWDLYWAERGVVEGAGGCPVDWYPQLFRLGQRGGERSGLLFLGPAPPNRWTVTILLPPPPHTCVHLPTVTSICPQGGMLGLWNGPGAGGSWSSTQVALGSCSLSKNGPANGFPSPTAQLGLCRSCGMPECGLVPVLPPTDSTPTPSRQGPSIAF